MDVVIPTSIAHVVAEAVVREMAAANVSQATLAESTGIPRTTLIRRLAGAAPFTINELAAIAGVLNLGLHSLIPDQVAA